MGWQILCTLLFLSSSIWAQPGPERGARPAEFDYRSSHSPVDLSQAADAKRDEVIADAMVVIAKVSGEKKAELIFRLAECYWEKSKYAYAGEYQNFDADYAKWVQSGRKGNEPKLDAYLTHSKRFKEQALANYSTVLSEYPNYKRLDEVLYMLAYSQYEAGRKQDAIVNYSDLIRQFESSNYVADAYLALGEYYFETNELVKAQKSYRKAFDLGLKKQRTSTYVFALYKLAWCDFNHQQFGDALQKLKDVVSFSKEAKRRQDVRGTTGRDAVQLMREALVDMVRTFAQLGQVDEAYAYFREQSDEKDAYELMHKLAKAFSGQGMHLQEIAAYELLSTLKPDSPLMPEYRSAIMKAYAQLQDRANLKKQALTLAKLCTKGEHSASSCVVAEQTLRDLASQYHRYAQKMKLQEDYEVARDLYDAYLQTFASSQEAYKQAFFFAEILWDMGEWERAARAYDDVIARDAQGEFSKSAASSVVLTWERIVARQERPRFVQGRLVEAKLQKPPKVSAEKVIGAKRAIPDDELHLIAAYDQCNKQYASSVTDKDGIDELVRMHFNAALIYHNHNDFDEAQKRFAQIIERWPESHSALVGASLILDSLDARQEWALLERWAHEFRGNPHLMKDTRFASSAAKFEEGAAFNAIVGDHAKAETTQEAAALNAVADRFASFKSRYAEGEFASLALYNAIVINAKTKRIKEAIAQGEEFLALKSKSEATRRNVLATLAELSENIMQLESAAKYYEQFANDYISDAHAADMLYNAATLHSALANHSKAASLYRSYIARYPQAKDIQDVRLAMAASHEKSGEIALAIKAYGEIGNGIDALYNRARLFAQQHDAVNTQKSCQEVLRQVPKLKDDEKEYEKNGRAAAYCEFNLLDKDWVSYQKIAFNVPITKVKKQIALKQQQMQVLSQKYIDILKYKNGEWGVAGLYRAAQVQLEYVRALRQMPNPKGLNDEALELFRGELDNIVFPVEEDAIVALEKALDTAFELGIYSPVTLQIQETLATLKTDVKVSKVEVPFVKLEARIKDICESEIATIKSELLVDPQNSKTLRRLSVLFFEQGKYDLSTWLAQRVSSKWGEDAQLLYLRGLAHLQEGRFSLAAPYFKKVLEVDSKHIDAWLNLGALGLRFGDYKRAADAYAHAHHLDETSQIAAQGLLLSGKEG